MSCKHSEKGNSDWSAFRNFVENEYKISFENYQYICLLSDKGCLHCNKQLAETLPFVFNRNDFIIIISENGGFLNLSEYSFDKPNIIHTYKDIFSPYFKTNASYFGTLDNGNCENLSLIDANTTDSIIHVILEISDKQMFSVSP